MIVLVLQNVVTLSVNLADNIMLGAYAEVSLSGVAACNQIQFVYQQLLFALGDGIVIMGTQYFGKREIRPIKKVASIAMHAACVLAVALFLAVSFFPHAALSIFTSDGAIIAEGMQYLRIIRFTYLFFALIQILLSTLRSTGTVRIALGLSVWALVVNCCINYTLIYGHFGAPRLGVTGAAIGTLTARITELMILIGYIAVKEKHLHLRLRGAIRAFQAGSYKVDDRVEILFPRVQHQLAAHFICHICSTPVRAAAFGSVAFVFDA